MKRFATRPVEFHRIREVGDWRLKLYSIRYGDAAIDWQFFAGGLALAEAALPRPAAVNGRAGVGFLIAHRGKTAAYLVLGWWDQENELPLRVFVRAYDTAEWRPARDGESVCVWDLEVIWAEREAYVSTMLASDRPDTSAYLDRVIAHA
jgi:hypothetical protein